MQKPLKGKRARKSLFESIRFARAHDRGKGSNPYNLNRGLSEAPFKESLVKGLGKRLKAGIGQVNVLDKGTGTGRMLSEVKAFGPKRINATALTLSTTVSPKNRPFLDKVLQKSGLTAKHDKKYDLIYDCFGEDHFLKKELVGKSILRSISLLKKGGLLFTVIPVVFKPSSHNFTASEAKKMLAELRKKKPNIRVSKSEERKRIGFVEFTDLILRIEKL